MHAHARTRAAAHGWCTTCVTRARSRQWLIQWLTRWIMDTFCTRAGAAAAGLIWYNLKRQLWFWKYRGNYSGYALPEFSPHAVRMSLVYTSHRAFRDLASWQSAPGMHAGTCMWMCVRTCVVVGRERAGGAHVESCMHACVPDCNCGSRLNQGMHKCMHHARLR